MPASEFTQYATTATPSTYAELLWVIMTETSIFGPLKVELGPSSGSGLNSEDFQSEGSEALTAETRSLYSARRSSLLWDSANVQLSCGWWSPVLIPQLCAP